MKRSLEELLENIVIPPPPLIQPKPGPNATRVTLTIPISHKLADAIKLNPASVRVWARGLDGVVIVEKPNLR